MSGMNHRFVVCVAVVSGLAALAVALLRDGTTSGRAGVMAVGALVAMLALGGLIVLMRAVVVAERRSREKRS